MDLENVFKYRNSLVHETQHRTYKYILKNELYIFWYYFQMFTSLCAFGTKLGKGSVKLAFDPVCKPRTHKL